jgi:hypothetical protein
LIGRNRTEGRNESAALQLKDGILPFSHELQISDRFLQENDDSRRKEQIACFAFAFSTTKKSPCPPETCDHPLMTFLILGRFQFQVRIDCCEFEQARGIMGKLGGMRKPKGCSHSSAVNSGSTARRPHFSNGDLF